MTRHASVIGWKLDRAQRDELLKRFPAHYPDVIADHVTLKTNAANDPLPGAVQAAIIGRADDDDGLECLVVMIDGTTIRPDGSTFHITWSLDKSKGREARQSNDLLPGGGWTRWPEAIPAMLEPARFP